MGFIFQESKQHNYYDKFPPYFVDVWCVVISCVLVLIYVSFEEDHYVAREASHIHGQVKNDINKPFAMNKSFPI